MNRSATILALTLGALLPACLGAPFTEKQPVKGDHASSSSSSSSGGGEGGSPAASSSASTGEGGAAAAASSTASTGGSGGAASSSSSSSSGSPPVTLKCSGTVDCPGVGACAAWTYDVADDGTSSTAQASVTPLPAGGMPCMASAGFPDADAGDNPSDPVVVQCGATAWTLSLDRVSLVVYVSTTAGLSWTPNCQ